MYQVDITFFHEREEREWGEFLYLACGMSLEEALDFARVHASMPLTLTDLLERKGYDGCSFDVRKMADPEPHAYVASYEFMPGRGITEWHNEECHEAREIGK